MTKSKGILIKWKENEINYLIQNINKLSDQEIADNLNIPKSRLLCKIYHLKLRPANHKPYTHKEIKIIIDNYLVLSNKDIGKIIGRSMDSVKNKLPQLRLKRSAKTLKYLSDKYASKTQFKKGSTPLNTVLKGSVSIRPDKKGRLYKYVKTGNIRGWQYLHIIKWIEKYGNVPKRKVLACVDGNSLNCDPKNWEPITKIENLERNSGRKDLTDKYVINMLTVRNPDLKEKIKQYPELIELKRTELLLKRTINEQY